MSIVKIGDCQHCGAAIFEERGCCGDVEQIIYTCGCHINKKEVKK